MQPCLVLEAEPSTSSDSSDFSNCIVWRAFLVDEDSSDDDKSVEVGLQSCPSVITSFHLNDIAHTNYISTWYKLIFGQIWTSFLHLSFKQHPLSPTQDFQDHILTTCNFSNWNPQKFTQTSTESPVVFSPLFKFLLVVNVITDNLIIDWYVGCEVIGTRQGLPRVDTFFAVIIGDTVNVHWEKRPITTSYTIDIEK